MKAEIWPALGPDAALFRAYRYPDDLNPKIKQPLPRVFYRKENETGLSVGLTKEGLRRNFPGAAGMCHLTSTGVWESEDPLLIILDGRDHAEIQGVPTRKVDQEKALRIAKYLVRISTHCE